MVPRGLRAVLDCGPLCRESRASQTADNKCSSLSKQKFLLRRTEKLVSGSGYINTNLVVFTILQSIWDQTEFSSAPNQSQNGEYNLIWVNSIRVRSWFLCVWQKEDGNGRWSHHHFYLLLIFLIYILFIFYHLRCTLPDFPSVSSPASLPLLSCCDWTTEDDSP